VEGKLRDAITLASEASDYQGALALNALEAALLWCAAQSSPAGRVVRDARLQRAISHLYQNFHRPISLREAAAGAGVSLPHLNRLFRAGLATSPSKYLETIRLKRAQELLAYTSMSIQSVAAATGFESPYYFTNRFRKATGASPRGYRQNMVRLGDSGKSI
jgi:AraC family transcriptional regulator of arabinose operon